MYGKLTSSHLCTLPHPVRPLLLFLFNWLLTKQWCFGQRGVLSFLRARCCWSMLQVLICRGCIAVLCAGMKSKMQDLAKSLGLPNPAALTGGQP